MYWHQGTKNRFLYCSHVLILMGSFTGLGLGLLESGLPRWRSGKESTCQCRRCKRHRFDAWVGKIPWRRKWQPTPVFLPGKSHGQRNLAGYSPWGSKELDTIERLSTPTHIIQKIKCSQQCKQWPENGKNKPRIFWNFQLNLKEFYYTRFMVLILAL